MNFRAAPRLSRPVVALVAAVVALVVLLAGPSTVAAAPVEPTPPVSPVPGAVSPSTPSGSGGPSTIRPTQPTVPPAPNAQRDQQGSQTDAPSEAGDGDASFTLDIPGIGDKQSNSVVILLLLTVLSVAPSLLVLCTSFTRIVVVLSLTRNALGLPTSPPQQVIVGLSVFLTLFVMGPTLSQMRTEALDPLLDGKMSVSQAYDAVQDPLREFMLANTREGELKMFLDASDTQVPVARDEVPLAALVPAFVLSELKSAFIIGFVIFIPFLVIDLVVSAVLMGLGMMMMPPSLVALPFKLLLFIMLDGWALVVGNLLSSYV